jgi:hypothetical protein
MAAVAQWMVYGLAAIGAMLGRWSFARHKVFSIPAYFVLVNVACLVALVKLISGQKVVLWEPQRGDTQVSTDAQVSTDTQESGDARATSRGRHAATV